MSIDLGELGASSPVSAPGRPPAGLPRRSSAGFAAVLLLVALLAVGSAPPPRAAPEVVVPVVAWHQIHVVGDLLVVGSDDPRDGGSSELAAYRWPGGDLLWRVPSPVWIDRMGVVSSAGTLLLVGFPAEATATEPLSAVTIGLDPAHGGVRWRAAGHLSGLTAAGAVLVDSGNEGRWVRAAVDPRSGDPLWSWPLDPAAQHIHEYGDGLRVRSWTLATPDGRVEVRDPETGRLLHSGDLPLPSDVTLGIWGELLLADDGRGRLDAYGLSDLAHRWRMTGLGRRVPWFDVSGCRTDRCYVDDGGRLHALDARTGRVLWSTDQGALLWDGGDRLLLSAGRDSWVDGQVAVVAVDARTGEPLGELGRWSPLMPQNGEAGRPLGVRQLAGDRTLVVALDGDPTRPQTLAVLDESLGDCARHGSAVSCLRRGGSRVLVPVALS